jgi:hypothetical protein
MQKINNYNDFLINEKFDDHLKKEFKRMGVTDEKTIKKYLHKSHNGKLSEYIKSKGGKFTFGLLHAIFEDALEAKRKSDLSLGTVKAGVRILPIVLGAFLPILALLGVIFGSTRALNKILSPVLKDPSNDYPTFLEKFINTTMTIAEGELPIKDRFTRAFVVSDGLIKAIKPEVLHVFSLELSKKMSKQDPDDEVPSYYVENQLKKYLNRNFNIDPKIPLK